MDTFIGRRQRQAGRLVLTVVLGAAVGTGAGWGAKLPVDDSQAPQTFGAAMPQRPTNKSPKPVRPTPSERAGIPLVGVPEAVRLKPIDVDAVLREDAFNERRAQTKILRYGIARSLHVAPVDGAWYDVASGARMWVGDVVSTDALGVRLHFKDVHLPAGAELAVYSPTDGSPTSGVAKSGFSRFDPDRYVEHYTATEDQRTDFWTGTLMGERARIEYLAPAGAAADELPFAVDNLQHLYLDPIEKAAKGLMEKAAGSCNNDVTCQPAWADVAKSVGLLGIVFAGGTGICTGQLLTTQAGDFTPYFLTANHCLSTASEAASTEYFWFYQTSSCNGTPPSLNSVPRSLGGSLVSTNAASDYTLLMVEGALPDGVFFSGWTAARINDGTDATAIHHPSGDFKRISFGFKDADSTGLCGSGHVRISWTDGPTEPGSSGSGIFRDDTQQVFGQLHGGPSSCGNESFDCYGAFSTTYPRVKNFLKQGSDDNSEQNDTCGKAKGLKQGKVSGRIVKLLDSDWYKISVPAHKTITVHLDFSDANGDVDLAGFGGCGSDPLDVSDGIGDEEEISLTNSGTRAATAIFQVFLANDTRNSYSITTSIHN
jgi:lysyl endopeptidase